MTDEDEAFNDMEKQSMWRKRAVQAAISTNPYRDQIIEEVAKEVEKLTGFGKDTIDGLAIYIRNMKNERKDRAG
jgi:CHASE3 domain sensor protein